MTGARSAPPMKPMPSKFVPLGERVLVRLDVHDGRSAGGIHLPETAAHSMTGTVEAVGGGVKDKALVPGLKVHFTRFAGATGDEIEPGVFCVLEAHLAGYFAPRAKRRKR